MTTRALARLDELVPRGSLLRFSIAGGFNSAIFFFCWLTLLAVFSKTDVRLLWGLCWGSTGVFAHFVHRSFTFDDRKPVTCNVDALNGHSSLHRQFGGFKRIHRLVGRVLS